MKNALIFTGIIKCQYRLLPIAHCSDGELPKTLVSRPAFKIQSLWRDMSQRPITVTDIHETIIATILITRGPEFLLFRM